MEKLKKALMLRAKYNKMDFNEFVKNLESYLKIKIDEKTKEKWKYMGLNNTDMLLAYLGKANITIITGTKNKESL